MNTKKGIQVVTIKLPHCLGLYLPPSPLFILIFSFGKLTNEPRFLNLLSPAQPSPEFVMDSQLVACWRHVHLKIHQTLLIQLHKTILIILNTSLPPSSKSTFIFPFIFKQFHHLPNCPNQKHQNLFIPPFSSLNSSIHCQPTFSNTLSPYPSLPPNCHFSSSFFSPG